MLKKKLRRLSAMLMAGVMAVSMMGTAFAAEGDPAPTPADPYVPTDSYALNYNGIYDGHQWQYFSPYIISWEYDGKFDYNNTIAFSLYNTVSEKAFPVYCTDIDTGLDNNSNFRRINLEDSTYHNSVNVGILRSAVLNGFPNVGVTDLGIAAGVENLTMGEAVTATQAAIWQLTHGSLVEFKDFVYSFDNVWSPTATEHYTDCYAEIENGYSVDANETLIESHIEAVFNYLINLEPTAPQELAVSNASFKSWSNAPVLVDNGNGTYNITVSATVNVEMTANDAMTLTAVLGDYSASKALSDGENTVELTIENVPADKAREAVTLAIDGNQTVSDVFLFDSVGERGTSQSLIGMDNSQLPVHAEVKVEPERIINFHKTTKIVTGQDAETGKDVYTCIPLEGIQFDVYFAASMEEYLDPTGETTPNLDFSYSGQPDFSVVTDENGEASISLTKNNMPDGVYLVVEREHPAIKAAIAPFYIMIPYTNTSGNGWEYVVNIQPKNEVKGEVKIEKDVVSVGQNEASVDAYAPHTWIIGSSIPLDIDNGKEYKISDTLDNRLDFLNNVKVQVEDTQEGTTVEPVVLAKDVDYKLTVVDNDSLAEGKPSDSFTIELTKAGMKKVAAAADCNIIRVYFDAQINANAQMGENIENQAHLDYTNSVNFDFDADSDKPFVNTGAANLLKVDGNDAKTTLSGATFQLYRAATAAEIADTTVVKTHVDGIDAPVILVEFFDNAAMTGKKVTSVVSGADGKVAIYGLAYGTYYLVETAAPSGYNLLVAPVELTVNETSHTEAAVYTIENFGGFELPETGGIGTTVYTLMGSVTMAASGMYIFLKKRED